MDFTLNFCEYNRSNSDYDRIFRPEGSGDFLFLLFKTPMKIYLGGQLTVTRDNACIFYIPGTPQHYQAVRKFRNSYVHFSCGENLAKRFGLPCNEIFYPSDCQEIDHCIQKLQHEYLNREVFSRDYEYALLCQLMITASRELRSTDTGKSADSELCSLFQKIRLEMLTNYEKPWTTEKLCAMANLEKSQFYSCYRNFFDSTPHADLNLLRLEKAKNLLTNEALPVQQVALLCGFSNLSHFSRYFRKNCGCSPSEWARRP